MPGTRHFKTVYKNEYIKITGSNPTYTVTWPDGKAMIIERFAKGWYAHESPEQHWADDDIAGIGLIINQRTKQA
jgi:hypothetical protein